MSQRLSFDSNDDFFGDQEAQPGDTKSKLSAFVTSNTGFIIKYKTEMCRNWELFGFCEFNDSVIH